MHRSAYWTLVKANKVFDISKRTHIKIEPDDPDLPVLAVYGFPCGKKLIGTSPDHSLKEIKVALVHDYIWMDHTNCYKDAPEENHVKRFSSKGQLDGYKVAVFGDNHIPFSFTTPLKSYITPYKTVVWNCGTFMRRRSDERELSPRVGIIYSNGSVQCKLLDTAKDKFVSVSPGIAEALDKVGLDSEELLEELRGLGDVGVKLLDATRRYMSKRKVRQALRDLVLSLIPKEKS